MPKPPRDPNQLAKLIVDIAIGEVEDAESDSKRRQHPHSAGGLKGGPARAKRREIAKAAARSRWGKDR